MVRSVLTVLDALCQASLGTVRFRWQASPLAYDPVAGLAEDPTGRCDRLLKSLVDRFLEPVAEPTAPKLPPQPVSRVPISTALRPQGSAKRDAVSRAGRSGAAGVASNGDRWGRFPSRRSERTTARGDTPVTAPRAREFQGHMADAVARILGRHDLLFAPGESAGGAMNAVATKMRSSAALSSSATPGPANSVLPATRNSVAVSYRRRPGATSSPARPGDATKSGPAHFDERVDVDGAREPDSGAVGHASRRGSLDSAGASKGGRFAYRRAPDSDGDIRAVLGKSPMSRRGLSVPIEFDHAVSADRLSAWAYGAMRVEAPRPQVRSPKPTAAEPAVFTRDSASARFSRTAERIDGDHSRFRESDILGTSSSNLGRLVHRWHARNKGSLRKVSVRELTRPHVHSSSLSDGPPTPELSTSTLSDSDFAHRLENVLLRESRRHGIIVEDQ
jgi:hypothetical protein